MSEKISSYKDLIVWQKAMQLVSLIYVFTKVFPNEEKFGLQSQMRRAAVSVPSNIAEGRRRGTRKDFAQFLLIAYGSVAELETQLQIARDLCYVKAEEGKDIDRLLEECSKMLNKMISSLRA